MNEKPSVRISVPSLRSLYKKLFEVNRRYAIPVLIVFLAKIVGAVWLYSRLSVSGRFAISHTMVPPHLPTKIDFFHIFVNWDTAAYMQNSMGYPTELTYYYGFMPGYSLIIRAFYMVTGDLGAAVVLPAFVFGVAWMPFFQAVAEHYMSRTEAMGCTLLAAFFPTVFLFTTVAYSEPMFLFACVASWYFYKKEKLLYACLMAAVATITRITGIFIVAPMFLDLLLRREWRRLPYTLIPPLTLAGWFGYCLLKTGDWLAYLSAQKILGGTGGPWLSHWVASFYSGSYVSFNPTEMAVIVLIGLLVSLSWRFDWRLALYAAITFFGILGFAGPPDWSYIRFFSFIFPIWLNVKTENRVMTAVACGFFYIHALMAWYQFHVGWVA